MRDFHLTGRSPLYAANAAIATSHPLASEAGLRILRQGGNAVDAGVTAAATLCVVEPAMTGIGGDGFALIHQEGKPLYGLNASGRAPKALSTEKLLASNIHEIHPLSAHSVTVPGVIKCWESLLESHGTISLEEALQPAISYAENGFPVAPRVWYDWHNNEKKLLQQNGKKCAYLVNGKAPEIGSLHQLPQLARTLKIIAQKGAKGFYEGEIARDIVKTVKTHGGLMSEEDMATISADAVTPVSSSYHDHDLIELPPNSIGLTAHIILNILENFKLQEFPPHSAERFHLEMEAARLGYAVRDSQISDPDTMIRSIEELIDKNFAKNLAETICMDKRNDKLPLPDPRCQSDTIYLSCIDENGMALSLINSTFKPFASGIVTAKTGIVLQNRGAGFTVEKGHPNTVEGGKRPLHTIIPAMTLKQGKLRHCLGVMGGQYQPAGHAHILTNMLDYNMDPQEALDFPRIFWDEQGILKLEPTLSEKLLKELTVKGHKTAWTTTPHGGGQIIEVDHEKGVLIAGSDHRKDGCAIGY